MVLRNYHTHSIHCDGCCTVDEMVRAAIAQGMNALGFSGHATIPFDLRYCTAPKDFPPYIEAVNTCKETYKDQLEIYLGVEDDFYAVRPDFPRDYTIAASHYMQKDGIYHYVDHSEELLRKAIKEGFEGDPYKMTAYYFEIVAGFPERMTFDFVGHFDLVAKFNESGRLFDEDDPRYWKPALEAMEHLCRQGYAFEVNTGAISRGFRTVPYPSPRLLRALHSFGGSIVFCCDSHTADTVCSYLPEAAELAAACGFRTHRVLTPSGWQEVPLGK